MNSNKPNVIYGKVTSKLKERVYKPLLILTLSAVSITAFSSRYTLLPPVSDYACIPGRLFIMDREDKNISSGDIVTFKAKNTGLFKDGTLFTKIAFGAGGDTVIVDRTLITNGSKTYHTDVSVTADHLKIPVDTLQQEIKLPSGKLFTIGTLPGSFDSRFWGDVDVQSQVIGKTYVIF